MNEEEKTKVEFEKSKSAFDLLFTAAIYYV